MLRSRSRAVIGKQSLVDHHRSSQAPVAQSHSRNRVSSFFAPAFGGFNTSRFCSDPIKPMLSPALILDVSPFSALRTPLADRFPGGKKRSWEDLESRGIGLAIIDKLFEQMPERNHPKSNRNLVVFGSSMKVRIPPSPAPALELPESPTDYGIRTRNSHLSSPNPRAPGSNSTGDLTECLSVSEMELSEDYTCITYHGANGRTTHIYDNCIVESHFTVQPDKPKAAPSSFLSFCYTCKKSLEQTKDIYIYRYPLFYSTWLVEMIGPNYPCPEPMNAN